MAKNEIYICDICGGESEDKGYVAHEITIKNEELNVWPDVCPKCYAKVKEFIASLKK